MDFPHVDERTEERFTRLWPRFEENQNVKAAAKDAPSMIEMPTKAEKEAAGGFHYKLYEGRIPPGVDADKSFGAWATDEARAKALEESATFKAGKAIGDKAVDLDAKYPVEQRYYPPVGNDHRKDFNKIVADMGLKDTVRYSAPVGAFFAKDGPVEALAKYQTPEMKAAWEEEGKTLERQKSKSVSRAADVVERAGQMAEGKDFLAKYGKGLMMPAKKEPEFAVVSKEIKEASPNDLREARAASEREFKALERKQYAIHRKIAQERDPNLTAEAFKEMKPQDRWEAAGKTKEFGGDEFRKMSRMREGFFAIGAELRERGEHLTVAQARDIKGQAESKETKKPLDEQQKGSVKNDPPAKDEQKQQGRASSRGAAAAASLARGLGR